jgi:hypothetical protein
MTDAERAEFISAIAEAVATKAKPASLTDDEQRWVRMAIQREAQSIELRKAIIEKTLIALTWSFVAAAGVMFLEWAKAHGYKP